jgi:uncharacterized protein YbaP (TraB family)
MEQRAPLVGAAVVALCVSIATSSVLHGVIDVAIWGARLSLVGLIVVLLVTPAGDPLPDALTNVLDSAAALYAQATHAVASVTALLRATPK